MRLRLIFACALVACTLVPAVGAAAGPRARTHLKVRSCDVGDTARERHATFYARMRAIRGTRQMAVRFKLIDRAGDGPPTVIENADLSEWRRSSTGVRRFGYAQSVAGLAEGGVYSVRVQFRWIGADGHAIRTVRRRSRPCRQQGELPNLAVTRVAGRPGDTEGTELYSVDVTNSGEGAARAVNVDLFVDGAEADAATLALLAPGDTVTVRFTAPLCRRQLRIVADKLDELNETNEDDNVLRSRCPAIGR